MNDDDVVDDDCHNSLPIASTTTSNTTVYDKVTRSRRASTGGRIPTQSQIQIPTPPPPISQSNKKFKTSILDSVLIIY